MKLIFKAIYTLVGISLFTSAIAIFIIINKQTEVTTTPTNKHMYPNPGFETKTHKVGTIYIK